MTRIPKRYFKGEDKAIKDYFHFKQHKHVYTPEQVERIRLIKVGYAIDVDDYFDIHVRYKDNIKEAYLEEIHREPCSPTEVQLTNIWFWPFNKPCKEKNIYVQAALIFEGAA